jgi:pimeloyl-ACP methyl ester carboxylesterase
VSTAYLGVDYSISTDAVKKERVAPHTQVRLQAVVSQNGEVSNLIPVILTDELYALGYSEVTEYLKFFVSTVEIDIQPLEQGGLSLATKRVIGFDQGSRTIAAPGWTTLTSALRIIRPQEEIRISPGQSTYLPGLEIAAHAGLSAKVSLNTSMETFRSADKVPPPYFRDGNLEPYNLAGRTRGLDADVLELFDTRDPGAVTEEEPLVIRFTQEFRPDECVMAFAYDADQDIYYPVGFPQKEKIRISQLPPATPSDSVTTGRSFTGSIKLYFQKMVSARFGLSFNYPLLRQVKVSSDLQVIYDEDLSGLKEKKQVYLYVHGIIGDSLEMVKSARSIRLQSGFCLAEDPRTAILAFDYENLNTSIQETAALLKQRLLDAGFRENSDRELIIIAHSMGGLVSRWLIEQLGGDRLVSHMYMFGTPNQGTAWANVRDYASTLLTFAVNGSVMLKPWTLPIAGLIKKIAGGTQITFEQMNARTGIYGVLNTGTDPKVPYSIVAGNTQEIDPLNTKTSDFIAALFKRTKAHPVYELLDLLLFKQPNDIAVATESIVKIQKMSDWKQRPDIKVVPGDHLNYFVQLESL